MRLLALLAIAQTALAAVLGIDYGSEFIKSSLVAPNIPFEIILTPDSKRKDASGLVLKPDGQDIERVYGSSGVALTSRFTDGALYFLKPLLGLTSTDASLQEFNEMHPGLDLVATDRNTLSVRVGKTEYPLEEVVAMSFKDIKSRAESLLNAKFKSGLVRDVAVSVPGHYSMQQRRALSDASELAGLNLISLVNDGLAVALNYASTRQFAEKQYFVVYDMGSECTTSTLFSVADIEGTTSLVVEGFGFDPSLGGKLVTARVRDILVDRFAEQAKVSTSEIRTPKILNRLWRESERAKAVLSANSEVSVHIESLLKDKDLNIKIKRADLEDLASDVIQRVSGPLLDSLKTFDGLDVSVSDIDSIVLAGGATRTPFVQNEIKAIGGDIISKNVNADEAAALGTTLRGVGVSGIFKSKAINVTDRTHVDYSISVDGGEKQPLFPRGSALDSQQMLTLNAKPDDETISVALYEGDEQVLTWSIPFANSALKTLAEDEKRKCVDEPVIEATFKLSHSRIVEFADVAARCTAEDREKPKVDDEEAQTPVVPRRISRVMSARPKFVGASPLSNADKQQLLYHLKSLEKADAERQRRHTLHNELEGLLYRVREFAPEDTVAGELLEWLEENDGTVVQLSERIKQAKELYKKYAPSIPETEAEDEEEPKPKKSKSKAQEVPREEPEDNTKSDPQPDASDEEVTEEKKDALVAMLKVFSDVGLSPNFQDKNWLMNVMDTATDKQLQLLKIQAQKVTGLGSYQKQLIEIVDSVIAAKSVQQVANNVEDEDDEDDDDSLHDEL